MSSDLSHFGVEQQSVVLLSPTISPLTISPKLLTDVKVVPVEWRHRDAISTPPLAVLNYQNGVSLHGEQGKLTISELRPAASDSDSRIHEMAISYVTAFPVPTYDALGLNWNLTAARDNAREWLIETFLANAPWRADAPEVIRVNPSLTFRTDAAECNLRFGLVRTNGDPEVQPSLTIACNFHHQGPFDLPKVRAKIQDWPARKAELVRILQGLA